MIKKAGKYGFTLLLSFLIGGLFSHAVIAAVPPDPLESGQWKMLYQLFFDGQPVKFDERVRVLAPKAAEDTMQVPVAIDVQGLGPIEEILVLADYNPIPRVLRYLPKNNNPNSNSPKSDKAFIGFRLKLQQSTPVRAFVRVASGVWYAGGTQVEAAGGGCTAPSIASANADWADKLGEIYGKLWNIKNKQRVRFQIYHPMDTGLVAGIPAFYIENLSLNNSSGESLAELELFEPVSENPTLSLDLNLSSKASLDAGLFIQGRDNNGNLIKGQFK